MPERKNKRMIAGASIRILGSSTTIVGAVYAGAEAIGQLTKFSRGESLSNENVPRFITATLVGLGIAAAGKAVSHRGDRIYYDATIPKAEQTIYDATTPEDSRK